MNHKQIFTVLAGVIFAAGIITACGGKTNTSASNKPSTDHSTKKLGNVNSTSFSLNATPPELVVDLSSTATAGGSTGNCYEVLDAEFELGLAVCATDSSKSEIIKAKHVEQQCAMRPWFKNVAASEALVIAGCTADKYNVIGYVFNNGQTLLVTKATTKTISKND